MPFKTGWKINVVNIEIISRLTKHHSKQLWITAYVVNVLTIHSFLLYTRLNHHWNPFAFFSVDQFPLYESFNSKQPIPRNSQPFRNIASQKKSYR